MQMQCALGLSQGAPVVAELCLASLRRIRCYARTLQCEVSQCKHPDQHQGHLFMQTELVTSPCVLLHIRVPVYDLIFALGSLYSLLKAVRVLSFSDITTTHTRTPACFLLLVTSGTQLRTIQTQITSLTAHESAQTGLTAQLCIHAQRQLIASSVTVGERKGGIF